MMKLLFSLIAVLFFYTACNQQVGGTGPEGYDLSHPEVLKMPVELNEVSGIAFNKGNADTIFAEQDEEGRLFYFPAASQEVKHQKFSKKGDYEDIAIINGTVLMLRSDGVIFSFPLNTSAGEELSDVKETPGLLPAGEYEGMFADEATSLVYVLCKSCSTDKEAKNVSGYILQLSPDGAITQKSRVEINTKSIADKLSEKKLHFRPSALAKNPVSKQWFIVSSVNKLLVIADEQWGIKEVYPLSPAMFAQPEGIAFDRTGNLYISNERGDTGNATILKFNFVREKQ